MSILNLVMIDLFCLVCFWCALISLSFGWSASVDNLGGIQSKSVKMCPYIIQSGSV